MFQAYAHSMFTVGPRWHSNVKRIQCIGEAFTFLKFCICVWTFFLRIFAKLFNALLFSFYFWFSKTKNISWLHCVFTNISRYIRIKRLREEIVWKQCYTIEEEIDTLNVFGFFFAQFSCAIYCFRLNCD